MRGRNQREVDRDHGDVAEERKAGLDMKKAGKTGLVCDHCKGLVEVERATSERPYRYDMSGIGNIFLVGIDVEVCKKCGSRSPIIPKVAGLHKAIAEGLLDKQDSTGWGRAALSTQACWYCREPIRRAARRRSVLSVAFRKR